MVMRIVVRGETTILGAGEDVAAGECDRDACFLDERMRRMGDTRGRAHLDGGGLFKSLLKDAHQQLTLQHKIFKVVAFRVRDVLREPVRGACIICS